MASYSRRCRRRVCRRRSLSSAPVRRRYWIVYVRHAAFHDQESRVAKMVFQSAEALREAHEAEIRRGAAHGRAHAAGPKR